MRKIKKSISNLIYLRLVLLNKKRDKKAQKNKKKSEILDKYKQEIEKDLNIEDKAMFNLIKEKKVINKEKATSNSEKSFKSAKIYQK